MAFFVFDFGYAVRSEKFCYTLATRYAVKKFFFLENDYALHSEKDVVPRNSI